MKRGLLFLAVLLMGFAVKGVAQADGEYYLYNEATKMFLSRGENYGTRAIVDKYGIPVAWNATDASLKVLDSNTDKGKDFLFQTGTTIYTDGVSTGFAFEETTDGYYLKSNQSGSYLTLAAGTYLHQVVALTTEASAATVWQLKTKAEHDAIVGEYANRNLENVATAAGLSVSADAFVTTLGSSFTAVDMTASIGTAKFTDGAGDWTFTGIKSQKDQPKYGADFCELWQATGYYTQTITGLAEGIYKVTVNALERSGDAAACVTMGQKGYEITTASLIANTEEVALKSWYGERSSDTWPNNTNEAISDFAAGKYLNEVYTYVGADGELKLTLAKPGHVANNWVIFNNFTLTYYEKNVLPFGIKSSVPANESIVLSLSELELTFSADAALVEKGTTVSLKNEAGEEVAVGTLKEDTEDYDVINVEFDKTIDTKGAYTVTIPAGAVKEYDGENVNAEVTYTINVDPEYWDPSWVIDLPGGDEYKEAPTELIVDRKYNIANSGTTYVTYTATETGRLYFLTNTTNSTTVRTTDGPNNSWYIRKTLNGTQDEETGNYSYWMGVQAGETYYITFYYYGKSRIFDLVFEAGQPYEPIAVTQMSHKDGDLYSRAIRTDLSYQYGAIDFRFNAGINADEVKAYVVLPSKDNAKIDVTSKNKLGSGNLYYAVCLGDTIEAIKEKYELKAGDKIQVVLENVQDQDFADNKLAENPSVELTLAGIVCSSVYPYEDNAQESVPSEVELTFDGEVVYGTGYVLDLQTNEKTDIPAANFVLGEPTTNRYGITTYQAILTLPEVTLSSTTKKFAIVLEDLKDKDGSVITYGETEGKFTLTYSLTDDRFAIESIDPAKGAEVTSLQTIKFTFADNVNLATGENAPYLTNYDDFEMGATLSVDANDPKSVIMTLDETLTTPGEYYIVLPEGWIYNSLYDASKEDLGLADGAIYNPYYTSSVIIPADFSDIAVTEITPDSYANTGSTVEELPAEVVVTFSAAVKEITAVYGLGSGGATPYAMEETPEGADALTATIDGDKVKIQVPAEVIAANTYGEYQIVLGVVDANGKAVAANANDPYDGHVVFSYYIQPSLKLVSYTPEGENLEKVEKIVLTFSTDVYPEYAPSGANMWMGDIALTDAEGNAVGGELTYTFSGKEVTITPTTALTEKGAYKLSIPEEMFYESAYDPEDWYSTYLYNKEINLNFFVQMTNPAVANLTTAVAEAKAWIATLDATNADHAEVIALVNPLIEEGEAILADLDNSTLEEVQAQADALNEAVSAWRERFEKQALAEELQTLVTEASEVYASIDETTRTDEAGLQEAIQSAEMAIRYVNWGTLEDLEFAKTTLEEALAAFKVENNYVEPIAPELAAALAELQTAVTLAKEFAASITNPEASATHYEAYNAAMSMAAAGEAYIADPSTVTLADVQGLTAAINEQIPLYKGLLEAADAKLAAIAEAQTAVEAAEATYAKYENPIDNAGLADAITNVKGIIDELASPWGMSTVEDLTAAVTKMKEAEAAFIAENDEFLNGIDNVEAGKEVVAVKYFTLNGVELTEPVEGVIVKKTLYADGTVTTVKMVVKK